jgi:hypothetical protein
VNNRRTRPGGLGTNANEQRPRREEATPTETADDYFQSSQADEFGAPPLHGKMHPHDMHFIVPTIDDSHHPHHPNEAMSSEFDVDPDASDAAADLAGDLGAQFLEGITYGEDMSERALEDAEALENELPYLVEEMPTGPVVSVSPEELERAIARSEDDSPAPAPSEPAPPRRAKRSPRRAAH